MSTGIGWTIFFGLIAFTVWAVKRAQVSRAEERPAERLHSDLTQAAPRAVSSPHPVDPAEEARRTAEAQVAQQQAMFNFDPQGPDKTAVTARSALLEHHAADAFTLSVKSIDRLHDLYVYERFRQRQASPTDAFIVDTLRDCLAALRNVDPSVDVRGGVREATHRLRTISTGLEAARGDATLYRRGLDDLARLAPDVDVEDIFWN